MKYKPLEHYVDNMPCSYGLAENESEVNVNVVKVSNVDGEGNFYKKFEQRSFSKKELERLLAKRGDLLVVKSSGSRENILSGKTALVNKTLDTNIVVSNFLFRLSPRNYTNSRFLWYYLNSKFSKLYIKKITASTTYPNLKWESYSKLPIPDISEKEQANIVQILDEAVNLINNNKELLTAYDELLKATFLDMFGDPVRNDNRYKVKLLSEVSDVVSGVTKGRKFKDKKLVTLPYMRVANVQDGHLVLDEIKTIEVLASDLERYKLIPGDILLTEGGDPDKLGRGAVWNGEIENCIHQNHIYRVRIKTSHLNEVYLNSLIGSIYGKRYFLKAAKQTTGIATINTTQLKKFPVLMAPVELQNRFKEFVKNIVTQKALLKQSIQESEDLFNALVQKAFKGDL